MQGTPTIFKFSPERVGCSRGARPEYLREIRCPHKAARFLPKAGNSLYSRYVDR